MSSPHIAVTLGDPRGIGPEVALRALDRFESDTAHATVAIFGPTGPIGKDAVAAYTADHHAGGSGADPEAGAAAAESIVRAVEAALAGDFTAVVTGPVHKPSLHAAGHRVPGQTEMLAALTGAEPVGMLMATERSRLDAPLRVLLATTHLALRDVPAAVSESRIVEQATLLAHALRTDWRIAEPRLALCALNPHASDGGLFGREEAEVLVPAVERLVALGTRIEGPVPADTVFARALAGQFDAVVAPYHDVGMAAFKTVALGRGVNVTLGLPFVRTSPDHGTAFEIAGTGTADESSMLEALRLAVRLANARFDMRSAHV